MNILEHYIEEVISVEPFEEYWTKEFDKKFLKIKAVTNCHGHIEKIETVESEDDWKEIKERGYFMR